MGVDQAANSTHGRARVRLGKRGAQLRRHARVAARFDRRVTDKGEPAEKRTPVLLAEEDFDEWLDASPGRAPIYFGTFGKDDLEADPAPSATRRTTQLTPLDTTTSDF